MSQHQARVPVKCLKQTALTWKVKDKATSQWQEVMQDLQTAVSGVNQGRQLQTGRDCSPQSFDWGTAVLTPPKVQTSEGQCRVLLREISKRAYHIL